MNEIYEEIQKVKAEIAELKDMLAEQKEELDYLRDTRDFSTADYTRDIIREMRSDLDDLYERKEALYVELRRRR